MDNKLNYTEENEEREDGKLSYRTPIYLQLREIIRNRIEEGEYLPGTAIPSENKLAETYGINRLTVRNAVDTLVNEGILRRVQGKGVFVVGVYDLLNCLILDYTNCPKTAQFCVHNSPLVSPECSLRRYYFIQPIR